VTVGRTGVRKTVGIPGTGLYYTSHQGYHTGYHSAKSEVARPPAEQALADQQTERTLGFIVLAFIIVVIVVVLL
jgi:hypothetical protein